MVPTAPFGAGSPSNASVCVAARAPLYGPIVRVPSPRRRLPYAPCRALTGSVYSISTCLGPVINAASPTMRGRMPSITPIPSAASDEGMALPASSIMPPMPLL